jgi:hypothetical protein
MSWFKLEAKHVLEQFNSDERSAIAGVQVNDGLPGIILSVTKEVRGYVAKRNPVSSDLTLIPDELKGTAIAIVRYRFLNAIPGGEALLTETRRDENKAAVRLLELIAKGDGPAIEEPTTASDQEVDAPAPRFSSTRRTRRFNDCNQDGI